MVTEHIRNIIIPHYQKTISAQFNKNTPTVELDIDGETLHIHYPSVIAQKNEYISDSIRLEFGGRNFTTPNEMHVITADISEHINTVSFPEATVTVLSPQKTYWEKLSLIHYECNRPTIKEDANRISRHWYDIAMLTDHNIGKQAINNYGLLQEVIKIQKAFYNSSFAKFDDCLLGNFRLIPHENYLKLLKSDFNKMLSNKMFYGNQPDFDVIISKVKNLQNTIKEQLLWQSINLSLTFQQSI